MEESRYNNWIWAKKRKNDYGDSWEERAFAVDAARYVDVDDYTWPPRSYSCNFCAREFKSAQALGGHMNVHRRDRARLKQSSNPSIITTNNHQPLLPLQPQKSKSKFSLQDSWSNLVQENICFCANDLEINQEKRERDELDKPDLSVNFDLVVEYSVSGDQDIINPTGKRRRILIDEPSLTLFPKSSYNKEELDLELRLGDSQKVK